MVRAFETPAPTLSDTHTPTRSYLLDIGRNYVKNKTTPNLHGNNQSKLWKHFQGDHTTVIKTPIGYPHILISVWCPPNPMRQNIPELTREWGVLDRILCEPKGVWGERHGEIHHWPWLLFCGCLSRSIPLRFSLQSQWLRGRNSCGLSWGENLGHPSGNHLASTESSKSLSSRSFECCQDFMEASMGDQYQKYKEGTEYKSNINPQISMFTNGLRTWIAIVGRRYTKGQAI